MSEVGEGQKTPNHEFKRGQEKSLGKKITWRELNSLIKPDSGGNKDVNGEWLTRFVKVLSTTPEEGLTPESLSRWEQKGNEEYIGGNLDEGEWALVGGVINKKLTEKKKIEKQKEILKGAKSIDLEKEKDLPEFFKRRMTQERELDKILKKDEKELTDEDKQRTNDLVKSLYQTPLTDMDLSFFGGSSEKPPRVEEMGVEAYRKWFEDKIHALVEEYPDQSFETNWTLTYAIQQGINNLWPKNGNDEFEYKIKGINGQEIIKKDSYTRLRKELAGKLESYRAVHNFAYLYRRVPGVGEAIGPAGLLENKYLQCLLGEKGKDENGNSYSVANALREFYQLGKEYRLEADEDERKGILKKAIDKQNKNWQTRVAGALYSGFQGGGRDDHLVLNEGGDFFTGRLYNMPTWAKRHWNKIWKRSDWPGLYKALDLRVKDFWTKTLKDYTTEELRDLEIRREDIDGKEILKEWGMEKGKKILKTTSNHADNREIFRFENAKFEKINLVDNLNITPDHLKHVVLDLEEADVIRKMILNPKGLIDNPGFGHINEMWEKFKHLKGKKRSEWFAGVAKELIWFFRDTVAPWSDSFPAGMRKGPIKEVFPYFTPMTDEQLTNIVWSLTPPLHKEDAMDVLNKSIGPKTQRVFMKGVRIGGATVGSMIVEGIKALLGLK